MTPVERARSLLTSADALGSEAAVPDMQALSLTRLAHYRRSLWWSLQSSVTPGDEPTWDRLRAAVPVMAALPPSTWQKASAQSSLEDQALDGASLADTVALVRTVAADGIAFAEAVERERALGAKQARRMGGVVLGLLVAVGCAVLVVRLMSPVNLADGKPWRASSSWGSCDPVHGHCAALVSRILFHTLEDPEPWFVIDLEKPTAFSSLSVVNRRDGDVKDRAVPLVAEVSDDAMTWRQVARRDEVFSTWKPKFKTETARYVRLRVARKSWLHLESVGVHP